MTLRQLVSLAVLLSVPSFACGDDGVGADGGSTGEDTTDTPTTSTTSATTTPSTSSQPTTSTTTDETTTDETTTDETTTDETTTDETTSSTGSTTADTETTTTDPTTSSTTDETTTTGDTESSSTESSSSSGELAECTVPQSHATIAQALVDVTCPTIFVETGVYAENLIVARDVTIEGIGDGDTTIDGSGLGTTVTIVNDVVVTLRSLQVTGGAAPQGAGIRNAGTLLIEDVNVFGNVAAGNIAQGGGIFSIGDVEVRASSVSGNTVTATGTDALGRGAGIWLQDATLTLTNASTVSDNELDVVDTDGGSGAGAGIFVRDATLDVGDATWLQGNLIWVIGAVGATGGHLATGGGIAAVDSTVTLGVDVMFMTNATVAGGGGPERTAEGGGLFVSGGTLTAGYPTFAANSAFTEAGPGGSAGGAMLLSDVQSTSIARLQANGNWLETHAALASEEVLARGGTIFIRAADGATSTFDIRDAVIDDSIIVADVSSTAASRGGGVLVEAQSGSSISGRFVGLSIVNSSASGDVAEGGGLGLLGGDSGSLDVAVVNATFSGNSVVGDGISRGGGVAVGAPLPGADVDVELRFVTSVANAAELGGAELAVWSDVAADAQLMIGTSIVDDLGSGATFECTVEGGAAVSEGSNLLSGNCTAFAIGSDVFDQDPMLGALVQDGEHFVHIPIDGSPAIDLIPDAECLDDLGVALVVDERDLPRPVDGSCEAGSIEVQP